MHSYRRETKLIAPDSRYDPRRGGIEIDGRFAAVWGARFRGPPHGVRVTPRTGGGIAAQPARRPVASARTPVRPPPRPACSIGADMPTATSLLSPPRFGEEIRAPILHVSVQRCRGIHLRLASAGSMAAGCGHHMSPRLAPLGITLGPLSSPAGLPGARNQFRRHALYFAGRFGEM